MVTKTKENEYLCMILLISVKHVQPCAHMEDRCHEKW